MRILSGMRPTGRLHLGNFHGALDNWLSLQNSGKYECYYFVADWHALTTDYNNTGSLRENSTEIMVDWLACGLDPERSTLFVQSSVKEHAELFVLLSMITPLSWLERNPTYKEMEQELKDKDISTFGFLGYPVLQAADIIIYRANGVPVGVDQLPHVELTREITRRFNYLYGNIFPVPDAMLTPVPKLMGIDGRKMSKSFGNAIFLSDRGEELAAKVALMFTDPQRLRKRDPGRPEICNVFSFHQLYSSRDFTDEVERDCRGGAVGCTDCKKFLAARLADALTPVHERQDFYRQNQQIIQEIIAQGNARARKTARETMLAVRDAVGI